MTENIRKEALDESIKLERNIGALYKYFSYTFPNDSAFWNKLAIEEESHATLIVSVKESFLEYKVIPDVAICLDVDLLIKTNNFIKEKIDAFESSPPSRETAFNLALMLEETAGEIDFQKAAEEKNDSNEYQLFKKLLAGDKNHFLRINAYMEERNIKVSS